MASWGRQQQLQQSDTYYQQGSWTKFPNRKPPHQYDSRQFSTTVTAWEKKFCTSVGLVPWKNLLDTKSCMYLYQDIVQWNDSESEEAFRKAKERFQAKINGLPCDLSLPDPDIYIDEIGWNPGVDPELVLDFERETHFSDDGGDTVGDALLLNQQIVATGWGYDEVEDLKQENIWEPVSDQIKEAKRGWGNSNIGESHKKMEWRRADRFDWENTDERNYRENNSGVRWYNSGYRTSRYQSLLSLEIRSRVLEERRKKS